MATSPQTDRSKSAAAEAAASLVEDGMVVGLGSGSTASLAVAAIGRRVRAGLRITGIPTSEKTAAQARALGIPLATLEECERIHLTIDGADEVERTTLNLIKGLGGALLREKIVAGATERFVVVVDERKLVDRLGTRGPVPVEVVPFGWKCTAARLRERGAGVAPRLLEDGKLFLSDGGHYILDCTFGPIASPARLAQELDGTIGVVHGVPGDRGREYGRCGAAGRGSVAPGGAGIVEASAAGAVAPRSVPASRTTARTAGLSAPRSGRLMYVRSNALPWPNVHSLATGCR